ncbi:unnamed protein product [Musa acuminata subsp. malaccensis]|uniref:(wild Malaysian banana) hypothetical protein n=1 Tax=Musa acuminata subsp. malaccensis TaxID=214687 RepID=A0A804JVA5_MUSAM|nr:unnamed protein product [Musa acuminata subsp. malaccensis]
MFRSSSATRMSDEHLLPAAAAARRSLLEPDGLPSYDPHSDISKKLVQRARLSENAVHVIPVVVVLCAIILWFFSAHESRI